MKDLNLIPKGYFEQKKKNDRKVLIIGVILGSLIILVALIFYPLYTRFKLISKLNQLKTATENMNGYKTKKDQLDLIKNAYKKREEEAKVTNKNGLNTLSMFENIEKAMPEKLYIVDYKFVSTSLEGTITIDCIADTEYEIASFLNNLSQLKYFNEVSIKSVKKLSVDQTSSAGKSNAKAKTNTAAAAPPPAPPSPVPPPPALPVKPAAKPAAQVVKPAVKPTAIPAVKPNAATPKAAPLPTKAIEKNEKYQALIELKIK